MKLIDYICQASGWTPVTREDENRPARDITPGSVVDVIVVDPYDDEFRILEKQTVLSVRPTADNDLGHDFVEVLIATDDDYGRGFDPFKIAAYRMVAKCEGTPEETIDKLEKAIGSAKKMKKSAKKMNKIDWTEIDGLIVSLRMTCGNAVAIANADAAWDSSSLYC